MDYSIKVTETICYSFPAKKLHIGRAKLYKSSTHILLNTPLISTKWIKVYVYVYTSYNNPIPNLILFRDEWKDIYDK